LAILNKLNGKGINLCPVGFVAVKPLHARLIEPQTEVKNNSGLRRKKV